MPLTPFQREVLAALAANRSPASHLAGGTALNRDDASPRYSRDLDIFHDHPAAHIYPTAAADIQSLNRRGYEVGPLERRSESNYAAVVRKGEGELRLEWTTDADTRFFPAQEDPLFGYCLHQADIATNKALALAGRDEIKDYLDILYLDRGYLSLGAIVWAAVGKDAGYTPDLLLSYAGRHSRYTQEQLGELALAVPVSLVQLKVQWLAAVEEAGRLFNALLDAREQPGCLYLDANNRPVTPAPGLPESGQLRRHFASKGGSAPKGG